MKKTITNKEVFIKPKKTKVIPQKEVVEPEIKYDFKRFSYDVENEEIVVFLKAEGVETNENDLVIKGKLKLNLKEIKTLIHNKFN